MQANLGTSEARQGIELVRISSHILACHFRSSGWLSGSTRSAALKPTGQECVVNERLLTSQSSRNREEDTYLEMSRLVKTLGKRAASRSRSRSGLRLGGGVSGAKKASKDAHTRQGQIGLSVALMKFYATWINLRW